MEHTIPIPNFSRIDYCFGSRSSTPERTMKLMLMKDHLQKCNFFYLDDLENYSKDFGLHSCYKDFLYLSWMFRTISKPHIDYDQVFETKRKNQLSILKLITENQIDKVIFEIKYKHQLVEIHDSELKLAIYETIVNYIESYVKRIIALNGYSKYPDDNIKDGYEKALDEISKKKLPIDEILTHLEDLAQKRPKKKITKGRTPQNKGLQHSIYYLQRYLQKYTGIKAETDVLITRKQAQFIYHFFRITGIIDVDLNYPEDNIRLNLHKLRINSTKSRKT
jgi:hypothetical protein